jgi:hypothetical protein
VKIYIYIYIYIYISFCYVTFLFFLNKLESKMVLVKD